jgi:iduronate 2-sulfatase
MQHREIPPIADPVKPASPHWHRSGEFYRYDFPFPKTRPLSASSAEQARRGYAACVRYVDRQVGRVLEALETTGQADNTIVVVWGDHGWHLGEQQIWAKHTPWERALRSVLIVRTPEMAGQGSVFQEPVETLDLYPTLVDLCALPDRNTAFPLDGDSFRAALTAPSQVETSTDPPPPAISFWGKLVTATDGAFRLVCQRDDQAPEGLQTVALYQNPPRPNDAPMQDVQSEHPERVQRLRQAIAAEQQHRL